MDSAAIIFDPNDIHDCCWMDLSRWVGNDQDYPRQDGIKHSPENIFISVVILNIFRWTGLKIATYDLFVFLMLHCSALETLIIGHMIM